MKAMQMTRTVPEWIGKTPDSAIPPRVRLRVFKAHDGICHISGRKIVAGDKWDIDHVKAIIEGGENREKNLAPALKDKHKVKTAQEVKRKSKVNKTAQKHFGITKPKQTIKSQGFAKSQKQPKIDKAAIDDVAVIGKKGIYR